MKKQSQKNRPARGAKNTDRAAVILSLFREFPNNKFSLKHLASASGGATKEGRRETFEILGRLHDEGIVEECAREKYRLTHKHLPHFEGIADMTASGSIYVRVEGEENDIFVNQRNTANALNGDRVEVVAIHRGRDGKFEGEITRIVERSRKPYVGVAEVGAHQIFVRADSRRMPMDIYLSKKQYPDVKDGEKVVVRIADWAEGSKSPVGELVERLGMAGNNDTEMHAILAEYELPYRFDPEIEQAAEAIDGSITAKVTITSGGSTTPCTATGNGRLDAVATAIETQTGMHFTLVHYSEHALDADTNARACSYVGLKWASGEETWGCGTHTDIIVAGIKALVSAINNR